ncbi:MAG: hypothetical protein AAGA65_29880 [Actinomycetota bacterium]
MTATDDTTTALDRLARHRATNHPPDTGQPPPDTRDTRRDNHLDVATQTGHTIRVGADVIDLITGRYLPVHVPTTNHDTTSDNRTRTAVAARSVDEERRRLRSPIVIIPALATAGTVAAIAGPGAPLMAGLLLLITAAMSATLLAAELANQPKNN